MMTRHLRYLSLALALVATSAVIDTLPRIATPQIPFWLMLPGTRPLDAVVNAFRSVQSASCAIGAGGGTCNATITSVVTGNTIVIPAGVNSSDVGSGTADLGEWSLTYELTSTTNVLITRAITTSTFAATGHFTVLEFPGLFVTGVQRATKSLGAGTTSGTSTITSVNTARSNIVSCGSNVSGGGAGAYRGGSAGVFYTLTDATTVTTSKNAQDGVVTAVGCFQVLERR